MCSIRVVVFHLSEQIHLSDDLTGTQVFEVLLYSAYKLSSHFCLSGHCDGTKGSFGVT